MKKLILSVWFTLFGIAAYAALPGTTCATATPLGENFSENITITPPATSKTVWYKARTFDLPLSVYFIPSSPSDPKPEVEMDFSCVSGVYEDSILCSLFCPGGDNSIQFTLPYRANLESTTIDGQLAYYLAMGKEYRDLLLKTGIDYNVDVYVKVTFKSSGKISIAPDDMFTSCMDGAKFMHLGDTIHVAANDAERHVIVPYVQWQEDSIRYVWIGEQPCVLAIGNKCAFNPLDYTDETIIDRNFDGGDTLKVTSELIQGYVQDQENYPNEAGMYFVKCYSEGPGILKVERVPMAPPQGGAKLLRYGVTTPISANDMDALYAIPYTWDTATIFVTPTDHVFRMYIGATHDFTKETAIVSYKFHANESGHWFGLLSQEMKALWANATGQYLYLRFECSEKTSVTPNRWGVSDCINKTKEIMRPKTTISVEPGSWGPKYYRFFYKEWQGGEMTFKWSNSTSTCPTYIGDNCTFTASRYDAHVIDNKTISKNSSWTVASADIAEWETNVDADGYLYIRFNPGAQGVMVISTTAPEEVDPAPVVYPAATVSVVCDGEKTSSGQPYIVRVSVSQTLNLYSGPADNIASRTPLRTWSQTPGETHSLTLQTGIYTLMGPNETIQIEMQ